MIFEKSEESGVKYYFLYKILGYCTMYRFKCIRYYLSQYRKSTSKFRSIDRRRVVNVLALGALEQTKSRLASWREGSPR